ncbi:MAG: prolipoprotein diacylglyceryl transferase [Flavobacteriales bacterium]|nr:prolipoprotein diacylglyceryl transferase [Flavobacteriales bacterium]MDG2246998.1 prolipoprotein diacylglyceryl transferase [Flavobacteriales bacterium]
MYPNLYYALFDLFGWDIPILKLINTFGFMVAVAFIIASNLLSRELKRKEKSGLMQPGERIVEAGKPATPVQIATNALMGFVFGYKFVYLFLNAGELFSGEGLPQEHIFSTDGSLTWGIVLAIAFGVWRWYDGKKSAEANTETKTVPFHVHEHTGAITMVAAVTGIIGAKLFHLFEDPESFMLFFEEPSLESFLGGLTIYGGLIMGALGVYIYARKHKINFLHLCDATAPGLMLAYGIGRIGCQISGDGDWGIANAAPKPSWLSWAPDWMWSYTYPNNVNSVFGGPYQGGYQGKLITEADPYPLFEGFRGTFLDPGVFPTPFYETVMATIIFLILWGLRKKIKVPGIIFGLYLIFNGFERFWIEKIRVNSVYDIAGLQITQAEIISTILFISGIILVLYLRKKASNGIPPAPASS